MVGCGIGKIFEKEEELMTPEMMIIVGFLSFLGLVAWLATGALGGYLLHKNAPFVYKGRGFFAVSSIFGVVSLFFGVFNN